MTGGCGQSVPHRFYRDAYLHTLGSMTQSRGTVGIVYTFPGQDGFGNRDWP